MFRRLLAYLIQFAQHMLFDRRENQAPVIDLDAIFARLTAAGEDIVDRMQRVMLIVFGALSIGTLAVVVLTARIYQLSANTSVSIGSLSIDGALLFGFVLLAIAGGFAWWLLGMDERALKRKREKAFEREQYMNAMAAAQAARAPQTGSPLEEAVALWIRKTIEEKEHRSSQGSTVHQQQTSADGSGNDSTDWDPQAPLSSRPTANGSESHHGIPQA